MAVDSKHDRAFRREAEKVLSEMPAKKTPIPGMDLKGLLHELAVHEIELEMQNEELRKSREQLEQSRNEYADLYDFAPVGYFTLDGKVVIARANLTAAGLFGVERSLLAGRSFALFVHPESQDLFRSHTRKTFETTAIQTCELTLKRKDGTFFDAQLKSIAVEVDGTPAIRTILTDISERKQAGWERERLESELREARKREMADEALRRSEEQFRALAEHSPM